MTDAVLVHIEQLTDIEFLYLRPEMEPVSGLDGPEAAAEMNRRFMRKTQVTDKGLACLSRLTNLTQLELQGALITDAGLAHLRTLTELQWLNLQNTQVTDAGLTFLRTLTELEVLNLRRTQVTDEGFKKLQQALPNCKITH